MDGERSPRYKCFDVVLVSLDVGAESTVTRDALRNAVAEGHSFYTDDDAPGAPFVRLPATMLSTELALAGSSAAPRITAMEMRYERDAAGLIQLGRVSAMIGYGEVSGPVSASVVDLDASDTRTMELEYAPADPVSHLPSLVSVTPLRGGLPGEGAVVRETRSFYDEDLGGGTPRRGKLTRSVAVLGESGQPDPTTTFSYDAFGNMKSVTSPRANAAQGGGTTTMDYDATFKTFVVQMTNAAGHAAQLFYEPTTASCAGGPPIGSASSTQSRDPTIPLRRARCAATTALGA